MPVASGGMELWRRMALLFSILIGLALFFYVAPAMLSLTAVDWEQEQADELKSISGYVSEENRRLNKLPRSDYINEKTGGKVTPLDSGQWGEFLDQVKLASIGQYGISSYGNRVSDEDKDSFWKPAGPVKVFFKPNEIPYTQWGLIPEDGNQVYISISEKGDAGYYLLEYHNYIISISAMSKPYRVAPGWLYNPYRNLGIGIMFIGLGIYIFLPRRKKEAGDISYSTGSMLAGDLVALILLLPFYGLPFLINGGTTQAVMGMWPITLVMWILALFGVSLFYYNAWSSSYRIELTPEALYLISFKGIREFRYNDIAAVNMVSLRNPGWFRKLFLALAFLSIIGGRTSTQPAGSALLSATASYGGLEISGPWGKPAYLWFTNQNGGIIINNFEGVPKAIEAAGIRINRDPRKIEGFSMFM